MRILVDYLGTRLKERKQKKPSAMFFERYQRREEKIEACKIELTVNSRTEQRQKRKEEAEFVLMKGRIE